MAVEETPPTHLLIPPTQSTRWSFFTVAFSNKKNHTILNISIHDKWQKLYITIEGHHNYHKCRQAIQRYSTIPQFGGLWLVDCCGKVVRCRQWKAKTVKGVHLYHHASCAARRSSSSKPHYECKRSIYNIFHHSRHWRDRQIWGNRARGALLLECRHIIYVCQLLLPQHDTFSTAFDWSFERALYGLAPPQHADVIECGICIVIEQGGKQKKPTHILLVWNLTWLMW